MAQQKTHKLLLTLLVEHKMTISTAWCGWHSSTNCMLNTAYIHHPQST